MASVTKNLKDTLKNSAICHLSQYAVLIILQNIGNIQTILLNRKIRKMIEITPEESNKGVILDKDDKGGVFIKFLSEEAKNIIVNYDFNEDEIKYLKEVLTNLKIIRNDLEYK